MIVLFLVLLNEFVRLPDRFAFQLDKLIDDCFGNSNAHLVILGFLVVVDNKQVLMNNKQDPVYFQLRILLFDDFS